MNDQTEHGRYRWIGRGIYTPAETARLAGISVSRVRRWVVGYSYVRAGERRVSAPVVARERTDLEDGGPVLTFRDLIEIMCVHGFLEAGVKWPLLRSAHEKASALLGVDHPFATRQFLTDGHSLIARLGNRRLLDLVTNQYALASVLGPQLKTDGLDFAGEFASRWWPRGKRRPIVIDAGRSFGQPIVSEGVPTRNLFNAYIAEVRTRAVNEGKETPGAHAEARRDERIIRYVASWFSVPARSMRAAVDYEFSLAA